jgi:hypothetical protein
MIACKANLGHASNVFPLMCGKELLEDHSREVYCRVLWTMLITLMCGNFAFHKEPTRMLCETPNNVFPNAPSFHGAI